MELSASAEQAWRREGGWLSFSGRVWESSNCQFSHSALQGVAGPVVVVPAQEPAGEGGRLEALLDLDDGRPAVPVGRIRLDVAHRWGGSGEAPVSASRTLYYF